MAAQKTPVKKQDKTVHPKTIITKRTLTVQQLFDGIKDELHLRLITRKPKLTRRIRTSEIHRPGLAFSGFYEYFAYDHVQILGKTEITYLSHLPAGKWRVNLDRFFSYRVPCMIVAKNQRLPGNLLELAEEAGVPIFKSALKTSTLSSRVTVYIEDFIAPATIIHGTLLDIYGVGTILLGDSGIGKSECALELITRGHRLVADDAVRVRLLSGHILLAASSNVIRHHMEIRGIGIIDVASMFGVGAVRNQKRISLVVTLEKWRTRKEYDRLGLDECMYNIMGLNVPHLRIPVKPGRNIPVLIESAALGRRAKRMGHNFAQEFNERLLSDMAKRSKDVPGQSPVGRDRRLGHRQKDLVD